MYKGKLWLDYQDKHKPEHYEATVERFILRDTSAVFEFSGYDGEEGHYSGSCSATKNKDEYSGVGEFTYPDGTVCKAKVMFTIEENDKELVLSGSWADDQDSGSPYELAAELQKN